MIEPLAEAIAALVKVLVDLLALMIEAMVWLGTCSDSTWRTNVDGERMWTGTD